MVYHNVIKLELFDQKLKADYFLEGQKAQGGGGLLTYMDYIGMCCCEGYGFQANYSRIGYINHSI